MNKTIKILLAAILLSSFALTPEAYAKRGETYEQVNSQKKYGHRGSNQGQNLTGESKIPIGKQFLMKGFWKGSGIVIDKMWPQKDTKLEEEVKTDEYVESYCRPLYEKRRDELFRQGYLNAVNQSWKELPKMCQNWFGPMPAKRFSKEQEISLCKIEYDRLVKKYGRYLGNLQFQSDASPRCLQLYRETLGNFK